MTKGLVRSVKLNSAVQDRSDTGKVSCRVFLMFAAGQADKQWYLVCHFSDHSDATPGFFFWVSLGEWLAAKGALLDSSPGNLAYSGRQEQEWAFQCRSDARVRDAYTAVRSSRSVYTSAYVRPLPLSAVPADAVL